nr:hypothetical protein [Hyphomonas sp. Mor2]
MFRAAATILSFDLKTLLRDQFLFVVAGITGLFLIALAAIGINREVLELTHWQPWIAYLLIMFVLSNAGTYGMLFGLIFVEEVETRARAALMVSPIPSTHLTLLRTVNLLIWLSVQPVLFVGFVDAAWQATPLESFEWGLLCLSLAPLGAAFMIILSTIASNRVEALAMGKFFSLATTPPMLLFLLPPDVWYRPLFLTFPTTPAVHGFDAFRNGDTNSAYIWLGAGFSYALIVLVFAVRRFVRASYRVDA